MSRKNMIQMKMREMDRKYRALEILRSAVIYDRLQYRHLCKDSAFYAWISVLAAIALLHIVFSEVSLGACIIVTLVCTALCFVNICFDNWDERRKKRNGQAATITFCFYSQKMLGEICAEIAKLNSEIEELEQREAQRVAEDRREREKKRKEARKLLPKFNVLFRIIEDEFKGGVECDPDNYFNTTVALPKASDLSRRFDWTTLPLTEDGLKSLAFQIAMISPVEARYQAIMKTLDAIPLAKEE